MTQPNGPKYGHVRTENPKHRKSRGGCITCKSVCPSTIATVTGVIDKKSRIRRKKCDETQPSCHRCTSTGRKCDGYRRVKLDALDSSHTRRILFNPRRNAVGLGFEAFLDHFRQVTIPQFAVYYNSTLWQVILAQTSVSVEDLSYAAIALGAAHLEHGRYNSETTEYEISTLHPYVDALYKSRRALSRLSEEHAVCISFALSLLLAAVEVLRDNPHCAIMHLANGLKISFSTGQCTIYSPSIIRSDCLLIEETTSLIKRLEVAFSGADNEGHGIQRHEQAHKDTRQALNNAFVDLMSFIHRLIEFHKPDISVHEFYTFLHQLEDWDNRLLGLSITAAENLFRDFQLLKICREAAYLLLLAKRYSSDLARPEQDHANCLLELKAYFSKLIMLEARVKSESHFIAHLTPAQSKLLAIRHRLLPVNVSFRGTDAIHESIVPNAIERLVMLDEDAARTSGLIPAEALCVDVTSTLEQGLVAIRYCVQDEKSVFVWVEQRAEIWKPAVFKNEQGKQIPQRGAPGDQF
ncbi:hypothetical protein LEMA_P109100.1 [Paecilomyces variotii No. 5]|uniref:Zn(2)-C6 fungal-type domain-containing protein n=1 Tax=Byssochlamys spectabilis (strain No. 5 / NBRC 109023) TaxID=1356009 RepID=V5FL50_BYSSN|nr:hypothetical protein LEMA_P109100.1 [Paecilomyces variotii No. 5]